MVSRQVLDVWSSLGFARGERRLEEDEEVQAGSVSRLRPVSLVPAIGSLQVKPMDMNPAHGVVHRSFTVDHIGPDVLTGNRITGGSNSINNERTTPIAPTEIRDDAPVGTHAWTGSGVTVAGECAFEDPSFVTLDPAFRDNDAADQGTENTLILDRERFGTHL